MRLVAIASRSPLDQHSVLRAGRAIEQPPLAGDVTPAASHDTAASVGSDACMANASWRTSTSPRTRRQVVSLASAQVVLNFYMWWPCKAEIPGFVELQDKYKDDLVIVGFSVDDPADKAKAFAAEYKMNYPILLGEGREDVQDAYGPIWGIPASFIISKDGLVCRKHLGIAPKAVFEKEIVALM
jgi:peroxiredoxin